MKFDNVEVFNFDNALRGMRNPMMSHAKSDTVDHREWKFSEDENATRCTIPVIGPNDYDLARRLIKAGVPHRKFLRQIFVSVGITAPGFWWTEADTYRVGTVRDSSSTMHRLMSRPVTADDFDETETGLGRLGLGDMIQLLNLMREQYVELKENYDDASKVSAEQLFRDMKRLLPQSYLYVSAWTANYEVLANMYEWRKTHRLPHWSAFCTEFIEKLPYSEFITGKFPNE